MDHKGIVAYLREQHGVGPWWRQMVAVTYEQEAGMRAKHQKPSGYEISRSKTIAVPVARLFGAWQEKKARGRWMGDTGLVIRKATPHKSKKQAGNDNSPTNQRSPFA